MIIPNIPNHQPAKNKSAMLIYVAAMAAEINQQRWGFHPEKAAISPTG
jgi:hypothetical protein